MNVVTEAAAKIHMQSYVNSSAPLITYLDNLFLSKQLGIDWWRAWKKGI